MSTTSRRVAGRTPQNLQASASSTTARPPVTQTLTLNHAPANPRQPVLHLRGVDGEGANSRSRIRWAEDVIDNEGLGRKRSKVCCIYHAPKGIDESSDESSSDSDSSESDNDDGGARPAGGAGRERKGCGHDHGDESRGKGKKVRGNRERGTSPNAYEKMPKVKNHGGGGSGGLMGDKS